MTPTTTAVMTRDERGEWVPAIPEPVWLTFGARCDCGRRFRGLWRTRVRDRYRIHYAIAHLLADPDL